VQLAGSVGILPSQADLSAPVTVWIRATVAATASAPALLLDRVARVSFLRNQTATARVFLALRCADTALGCTSVSAEACTVSVRCREQNATCGDLGECVAPEPVLTTLQPDGAIADATVPMEVDVQSGRVEDSSGLDASEADVAVSMDVSDVSDVGTGPMLDASESVGVPSQRFPQSVSRLSCFNPDFGWVLANATDGAELLVCADRACSTPLARQVFMGNHGTLAIALPAATTVFWKLRGVANGIAGTRYSPTWEFRTPARTAPRCAFTGLLADYNGDGFTDPVLRVESPSPSLYVYYGRLDALGPRESLRLNRAVPSFATSFANAGDVNGDGFADLVVSAPDEDMMPGDQRGTVAIYLGSATGLSAMPAWVGFGPSPSRSYGASVAGIGDFDGNGTSDIVVGAPRASVGVMLGGAVHVLEFAAAFPSLTAFEIAGRDSNGNLGRAVSSAGDTNADGFADVLAGARNGTSSQVIYGSARFPGAMPFSEMMAPGAVQEHGAAVALLGDCNGDGYSDVIVGAPNENGGAGAFRVYIGGASGSGRSPATTRPGTEGSALGTAVGSAGDVNLDGYDDVIAGAPDTGEVLVYLGHGDSTFTLAAMLTIADRTARFGASVGASINVNARGESLVLVGAPLERNPVGIPSGALYMFRSSRAGGVNPMPLAPITTNVQNGSFGLALAL
jgi:hypothetical protein